MQFGSSNGVSIDLAAASQSSADSIGTIVGEMKGILNQIRTSAGTGQASWSGQAGHRLRQHPQQLAGPRHPAQHRT